jgi:hypothetical protein
MAYTITQPSYTLYPSDNLSWSTAYSTDYTQPAFVYKFSVQVGTTSSNLATASVNRVPVTPGSTAASFAPNAILRNYVNTPVDFIGSTGGTASTDGFKYGRVIYGQEYNSGGTVVAATGATGDTFRFWNSIFSYAEWPNYDATEWVIGPTSAGVRFLTDGPVSRCLIPNDLLYVNVGGQDPTYTKEEIFPTDTWNWPTYSGYPQFFDVRDTTADTLPGGVDLEWQGGATGFILTGWPVPATTGNSSVYARQMPTLVSTGSAITVRIEDAFGYGPSSTNYPRWAIVGSTGPAGPWTLIGYANVSIVISPSGRFASFSGVSNGNYTYLGLQLRVTATNQLSTPTLPGPVTTWTYVNNEVYYWNIDKGATASKIALTNSSQNYLNVPKAANGDECSVYITDALDTILTEIIDYNNNCDVCSGCEKISLTWLNTKGGYDTFEFLCVNNKTIEANRTIGQQTLAQNYSVGDRGLYNTANIGKLRSKVNTNYVLEETVQWLESLFMSPSVYVVSATGVLTPIVVDNTTYQRFATPDKLLLVEFEYTEANLRTSQIK